MGYFSNGTEGLDFQERYCFNCVNWRDIGDGRGEGCPVIDLHMAWNYDQYEREKPNIWFNHWPKPNVHIIEQWQPITKVAERTWEVLNGLITQSKDNPLEQECQMYQKRGAEAEVPRSQYPPNHFPNCPCSDCKVA